MKTSDDFVEYIIELLSPIGKVSTKKMFGGFLVEINNRQLGIIFENVLYFKITTDDLQEKFKNEGSEQFTYTKKTNPKPVVIKNWWSAPDRVIDDRDTMIELAELVLEQK